MASRERAVRNPLLIREVNDRINEVSNPWLGGSPRELLCECRDVGCLTTIAVSVSEFRAIREEAGRFLVASSHAGEAGLRVLESSNGYLTVEFEPKASPIVPAERGAA